MTFWFAGAWKTALWRWLFLVSVLALTTCSFRAVPATLLVVQETTTDALVIRHALGDTCVPLNPQRNVAPGEEGFLADLLDAGLQPIAASMNVPEAVPLINATELDGIELFPSATQVSLERITTLDPDLIIGGRFFLEEAGYSELSQIAPTVALGASDPRRSYVEALTVLGIAEHAEADVSALEQVIAMAGAQLRAEQRSVSLATIDPVQRLPFGSTSGLFYLRGRGHAPGTTARRPLARYAARHAFRAGRYRLHFAADRAGNQPLFSTTQCSRRCCARRQCNLYPTGSNQDRRKSALRTGRQSGALYLEECIY